MAINGRLNDQKSVAPNGDAAQEGTTDRIDISSNDKAKSPPTKTQSSPHASLEPQDRGDSQAIEAELPENTNDIPDTKASTVDTSTTQGGRRTRKSMPAKLKEAEDAESNVKQSQTATPRPGRRSKLAAQVNDKIPKSASRASVRSTPRGLAAYKLSKDRNSQGTDVVSPAPSTTRGRRRYRKSTIKAQGGDANANDVTPVRSYRKRGSTTKATRSRDHEIAESAAQSADSNDTEIYGDGVDGPVDSPASTKNSGRISRRYRKPTMRAMESLESEKRFRRKKAAEQIAAETGQTSLSGPHHPDLGVVAQRLFELAAEAVSPDFMVTPDAKAQLKQLRKDYWARQGRAQNAEAAAALESGSENLAIRTKPTFSKKTKTSDPWTDPNGWTHTGHVNEHGEEYLFIPADFELYRPNNTYNDKQLPQPPIRLKSREQLEKDRVFGFPPRIGERNLPSDYQPFMFEDVEEERARIKAREDARRQGIIVDRSLPVAEIRTLIARHGRPASPDPKESPPGPTGGVRRRRRRTQAAAENGSGGQPKPRRRRQPATAPSTPAQGPESPDKKTMKIKLKFGKGNATTLSSSNRDSNVDLNGPSGKSRKRGHSATENRPVGTPGLEEKSTKKRRLSTSEVDNATPAVATTKSYGQIDNGSPASSFVGDSVTQPADQGPTDTPTGRPRRRGATTLADESQANA